MWTNFIFCCIALIRLLISFMYLSNSCMIRASSQRYDTVSHIYGAMLYAQIGSLI